MGKSSIGKNWRLSHHNFHSSLCRIEGRVIKVHSQQPTRRNGVNYREVMHCKKIGVCHLNFHCGLWRTKKMVSDTSIFIATFGAEGWLTQPERLERLTRREASTTMAGSEAAKIRRLHPAHLSIYCFETYALSSAHSSISIGHGAKKMRLTQFLNTNLFIFCVLLLVPFLCNRRKIGVCHLNLHRGL